MTMPQQLYPGAVQRPAQPVVQDESNWHSIDDIVAGVADLLAANVEYNKAAEFYEGRRREVFANMKYRIALQRSGVTYRINFAKTPVDSVVDRIQLASVTGIDDATSSLIEKIMLENDMDVEEPEVTRRACEFGDAYIVVWPDEDLEDDDEMESANEEAVEDADQATMGSTGVNLYYNDPRSMRLFYDIENPRIKSHAIKMWETKRFTRVNIYYADHIEKWRTKDGKKAKDAKANSDWMKYGEDLDNPYKKIPVFHFRTERPYGCPLHRDAYGPQDIINKLVITHMTTVDYHGFPQRWAISGGDLADGDEDTEEFGFGEVPSAPANPDLERNRSQLRAEAGTMWWLKNVKSVGQFPAALPATFMDPLATYIQMMSQLTTTPLHEFDFKGNPPSGESLRVSETRFIKKLQRLMALFGATWRDVYEFALEIIGHPTPLGSVKIEWVNPQARDDQLTWMIALMKRDTGVPIRQCLLDAGYSPKQLDAWEVPESKFDPDWVPPPKPVPSAPAPHINPMAGTGIVA